MQSRTVEHGKQFAAVCSLNLRSVSLPLQMCLMVVQQDNLVSQEVLFQMCPLE